MSNTLGVRKNGKPCNWVLKINGKNIDLGEGQDIDLDSYLYQNLDSFEEREGAIFFSKLSPLEVTKEKIKDLDDYIKGVRAEYHPSSRTKISDSSIFEDDPEEIEQYYIPESIGATKFITEAKINEGKELVTQFDLNNWVIKKVADLKSGVPYTTVDNKSLNNFLETHPQISPEELLLMEQNSWPGLTEYGTKVHKVLEDIFNGKEAKNPGLEDPVFKNLLSQVKSFKSRIETMYGKCTYYPEFMIKSKWESLSPEVQSELTRMGKNSISGIIDLLVVDEKGLAHIFDYKVSRKDVAPGNTDEQYRNNWFESANAKGTHYWSSAKKLAAGYQVELYREICKSYGIEVVDTTIIPIKLDLSYSNEDNIFEVTSLDGVEISEKNRWVKEPAAHNERKRKIGKLFVNQATQTTQDTEEMGVAFNEFFPLQGWTKQQADLKNGVEYYKKQERYVHKLNTSDKDYKKHHDEDGNEYRICFPGEHTIRYCKADQLDDVLKECIAGQKDTEVSKFIDFAKTFQQAKDDSNLSLLTSLVKNTERAFVEGEFNHYMDSSWQLVSDDTAHSLGIMVYRKQGKTEIVCLTNESIRKPVTLGKGTSILGATKSDKFIDSTKTLSSLVGNIALMKAVLYVNQHKELFENHPIAEIRAFNPWEGRELTANNSTLIRNFNDLVSEHPNTNISKIDSKLFINDLEAIVENCKEQIDCLDLRVNDEIKPYSKEWFEQAISNFTKDFGSELNLKEGKYENTPAGNVLQKLNEGLALVSGFETHIESDKEDYINGKFWQLDGLRISSPQFSSSANIRELGRAIDEYAKEVRKQVFIIGSPIQQYFSKLYDKYGTSKKVFDSWFVDTPECPKENLILKDPDCGEFDGDPTTKEALRCFLKTMCQLRHPEFTTDEQFEAAKSDDDYYALPLLEAKFSRQIKGVGLFKAIKNKWKEKSAIVEGLFMGEEIDMQKYVADNQEVYNKLKYDNMEARRQRLSKYNGAFETDLELVMNAMLVAFCRSNVSQKYIPAIAGMKMSLERADALGGTSTVNMENIRKCFNDMVRTKFYGESLIPKGVQPLFRFLNMIKAGFSTLTLSLNSRSFLRETLQGIYTGISRAGVKLYPGINEKSYVEGLTYVIQDCGKNFSGVSLLQQMNAIYGMANQSLSQVANQRRVNWAHINHWGKDTLFLTCTAPDFLHRMSLLVAKMKSDGCFDAHSLDENGVLKYDIKKDKRFEHLVKGETNHKDYLKEKSLYTAMVDDFNQAGFRKEDGSMYRSDIIEDLPQAYTRTEGQSIKNYADLLYGHYDEESKSLLYDTFIGSFFLQYKTYLTSKLEQWTMREGKYNIAQLNQVKDENGNPLYVKFYEDEDGVAHKDVIFESEYNNLNDKEKESCRLYYDYESLPLQGMLQETLKVVGSILGLTEEKFKEVWADPTTRAIFKLQLHDMWLLGLLTLLLNFIFGSAEDVNHPLNGKEVRAAVRKGNPLESFSYNVIAGSLGDAQLQNVLGGFTGDPPALVAVQKMASSTVKVLSGDASVGYWLTRNIGAIGDFQGMVEKMEEK